MPPSSNSFLPICCCMKSSPPRRNKLVLAENGELKHNLAIPRIKISPPATHPEKTHHHLHNGTAGNGHVVYHTHHGHGEKHSDLNQMCPRIEEIECEIPDDDFATARTHRMEEVKQLSMAELIYQVRLEEQLTARDAPPSVSHPDFYSNLATIPEQSPTIEISTICRPESCAPQSNSMRPLRAVFNDEGDISARIQETSNPVDSFGQCSPPHGKNVTITNGRYIRRNGRPLSPSPVISAISVPMETETSVHVRSPAQSSAVRRYVALAPQMIISVVTVMYTWMVSLIALFGRQIFK